MAARIENGREAAGLAFQYALVIFVLTVAIGLLNSTRLLGDLSHGSLMAHLHSGTLGWITMAVFGVALWLFGGSGGAVSRNVAISGLATAAYALAFWVDNEQTLLLFGAIELAVVVGWWWWVLSRAASEGFGRIDVPKISVLLGLTTLLIGSTVGVIVEVLLATGATMPTSPDLIGGHVSAQLGGYLVLISAGIAEWLLTGGGRRTLAGVTQCWLLFLGGLLLSVGVLVGVQPLLGLATLLQVIGIVIVIVRFGGRALRAPWGEASGIRHVAISVPFLVLGLILEIALLQQFVAAQGDITKVYAGLSVALDHTMFVGLMTNAIFGAIHMLTADRPRTWPWADHVVFWGVNVGVVAFIAAELIANTSRGAGPFAHPVAYTAPIMGLAILLGIATLLARLREARAMAMAPA